MKTVNMFRVLLLWTMAATTLGYNFDTYLDPSNAPSTTSISYGAYTGTVPTELGLFTGLNYLYIADGGNNLYGTFPTQIGHLSRTSSFHCYGASMTGTLPTEIGKMEYVGYNGDYTMLYSNSLTGQLPTEMGQMTALSRYLQWYQNSVSTRTVYPLNPAGNRDDAHRCERYLVKADQPHTQP
mmetsp:Transcript_107254/g.311533  ORF Transcript_107254/g.311533 Transcript_107254/m.311533 type:complete len:182 (-) Transcript_107254:833-1378(-)